WLCARRSIVTVIDDISERLLPKSKLGDEIAKVFISDDNHAVLLSISSSRSLAFRIFQASAG
ncbi:hypothetical protein ACC710_36605, partial [Rhizobium ruizarguesonis]